MKNTELTVSFVIINILVIAISLTIAYISYYLFFDSYLMYIIPLLMIFIAIFHFVKIFTYSKEDKIIKKDNIINAIVLINEENNPVKEWNLIGKTSMIIGRNSKNSNVDINLEDTIYSSLINYEHAVLNFFNNNWYIEDIYSENGVYIKKIDDKQMYKLSNDKPCKLNKGDVLYVGKTKFIVK